MYTHMKRLQGWHGRTGACLDELGMEPSVTLLLAELALHKNVSERNNSWVHEDEALTIIDGKTNFITFMTLHNVFVFLKKKTVAKTVSVIYKVPTDGQTGKL